MELENHFLATQILVKIANFYNHNKKNNTINNKKKAKNLDIENIIKKVQKKYAKKKKRKISCKNILQGL